MKKRILLAEYDRYLSFNNQEVAWVEQHLDAFDFRSRVYATQVAKLLHKITGGNSLSLHGEKAQSTLR